MQSRSSGLFLFLFSADNERGARDTEGQPADAGEGKVPLRPGSSKSEDGHAGLHLLPAKELLCYRKRGYRTVQDELEHTRAYLAVEQAQFEDTLFIDFDTPYRAFRLPPLTLQPIVENAVKHGMISSSDPIHISVVTRHKNHAVEIMVEDDGIGFDPIGPVGGNEPHIALNNIRERLKMMCSGQMTITPREGGGTAVTITIPDQERR